MRWQHPTRGLLGPGEFLPRARRRDLLGYVRQTVLSEACRQAAHWCRSIAAVEERFRILVNIDAQDLLDPRLIDDVAQVLAANRLEPARLCLEITETGLIDDLETSIESLLALRLLGVILAIDDFGTGYASLEYAHRLPVDEIKIDRAFIHQVGANPAVKSIVGSVIDLADGLGKQTVAEGVESASDLAELVGLGCHRAQGFYFSKPLPARELQDLLRQARVWPNRSVFAR